MPFLTLNGVTLPIEKDSVEESYEEIGDGGRRGVLGNALRTRTALLRSWSFRTQLMADADAQAWRKLIEGMGQSWRFSSFSESSIYPNAQYPTILSSTGSTYTAAGTFTAALTGGVRAEVLSITSGSVFGVDMSNKLGIARRNGWDPVVDGYTLGCWRKEGANAWIHWLLKGKASFLRGAATNPVGLAQHINGAAASSAFNAGRGFSVSNTSPFVGLHGYSTLSGAAVAVAISDFFFLPFEIPTSWVPSLYTFLQSRDFGRLPLLRANGDFIPETEPLDVIGRVLSMEQTGGNLANAGFSATNRVLEVLLTESMPS